MKFNEPMTVDEYLHRLACAVDLIHDAERATDEHAQVRLALRMEMCEGDGFTPSRKLADRYDFDVAPDKCTLPDTSGNTFNADGTLEYGANGYSYATVSPGCAAACAARTAAGMSAARSVVQTPANAASSAGASRRRRMLPAGRSPSSRPAW